MKKALSALRLKQENRRLKSALGAIHNALHHDDLNAAHEACECALEGGTVSQPSINASQTAQVNTFIGRFNALAKQFQARAACVIIVPFRGPKGEALGSVQLGGHVETCKALEEALQGAPTLYMGDHESGGRGSEVH